MSLHFFVPFIPLLCHRIFHYLAHLQKWEEKNIDQTQGNFYLMLVSFYFITLASFLCKFFFNVISRETKSYTLKTNISGTKILHTGVTDSLKQCRYMHQYQKIMCMLFVFVSLSEVPLKCRWSAVEVPLKCHWSAIEVPLNCGWSAVEVQTANSQQPQPQTFHLLTPPLSTVGWSKTMRLKYLGKKGMPFFVCLKMGHHRPVLGLPSLLRSLHNLQKWVFQDGTGRQTNRLTWRLYDWGGGGSLDLTHGGRSRMKGGGGNSFV